MLNALTELMVATVRAIDDGAQRTKPIPPSGNRRCDWCRVEDPLEASSSLGLPLYCALSALAAAVFRYPATVSPSSVTISSCPSGSLDP